jgi:hypothetical protein
MVFSPSTSTSRRSYDTVSLRVALAVSMVAVAATVGSIALLGGFRAGESGPRFSASPLPPPAKGLVRVVRPDARAANVPISGASPTERRLVRRALARLGAASPVVGVRFDWKGPRHERRLVVDVRPRPGSQPWIVRRSEAEWLGQLVSEDIVGPPGPRGIAVDWLRVGSEGSAAESSGRRRRRRSELRALAERIGRRGRKAHLAVESVTAYGVAGAAVRTVVRLTTRQTIENTDASWLTSLVPDRATPGRGYYDFLLVLGPNREPVAFGGSWRLAGSWAYGVSSYVKSERSPALPHGRTRLDIHIDRALSKPRTYTFRLDCSGGSEGTSNPREVCAAIREHWVSLLPPIAADTTCIGGMFDDMSLKGTLGGTPIERDYSNCYAETTGRWEKLLGVPSGR